MKYNYFLIFLLPLSVFASTPENKLFLYNEGTIHKQYDGAEISFTLNDTSLVPDKIKNYTKAYSISPIENWKDFDTAQVPTTVGVSYNQGGFVLIKVTADRNKNKDVAQWASDQQKAIIGCENNYDSTKKCNDVYAMHTGSGSETAPKELNFAFIGTIKLRYPNMSNTTFVCENVIIAQGNNGIRNNWWIYSNYWPKNSDGTRKTQAYSNKLFCRASDRNLNQELEIYKGTNNSFQFKPFL